MGDLLQDRGIRIHRRGPTLGDVLLAAVFTNILNDNGIKAFLDDQRRLLVKYAIVPLWRGRTDLLEWRFSYSPEMQWDGRSILRKALDNFQRDFTITRSLVVSRNFLEWKDLECSMFPKYDVVICSKTGTWSQFRNWPYFDELKERLTARGISWFDVSAAGAKDEEVLCVAMNARLYLGLETGVSHAVASVVQAALIIQSGYSNPEYWGSRGFKYVQHNTNCQNCFLTFADRCTFNHSCMREIDVSKVEGEITRILDSGSNVCKQR